MDDFHPIIREWFQEKFQHPTEPQKRGWPAIRSRRDTLIAAPTGSGKTLTAFLVCIDELLKESLSGGLTDATKVIYISPLKALSNDIRKNLETPLGEIQERVRQAGFEGEPVRAMVRTGDTTPSERQAIVRRPPQILVTTPESLYLLLTSEKSREILRTVETVIVDEIHALARDKRGSHLSLSLERLDHLCHQRPLRIGLSATQKPIEDVAQFLVGVEGDKERACEVIDTGHQRNLDLAVEVPPSELSAVCSHEQWDEVYKRLNHLIKEHRSTLIFVNTRKLAERVTYCLGQELGESAIASHHGSLSKEKRLQAEERLKAGDLKAIVATASLELGIDIGYVDLVCQIGSPRSIATFLQRVGRSGHAVNATPKGRLFALTRDELMESLSLIRAVKRGVLDRIEIPQAPLDILAQQVVAAVASDEWDEDELYQFFRQSSPYRSLEREYFDGVIKMLAEGFGPEGRQRAYLHHDAINKKIRPRKGARLAALTSGGAIPEQPLYRVINIDDGTFVGTLDEDFAIESAKGDIFLLGNTSWQIQNVRGTQVSVRDAHGAPPTIPFWFGEAPGRTIELSESLSTLRRELAEEIPSIDAKDPVYGLETLKEIHELNPKAYLKARGWLDKNVGNNDWANLQAVHYVAVQRAALGVIPTQSQVVFERFFDQTGGMQLVIHAPFGTRINRGWGLALRKRFCRSFDFELQAVADDDGIVLSLGPQQSFPVEQLFSFLTPDNVRALLEQAFLQVPFFRLRWQWNANRALLVLRNHGGKKVPPALQRFRGDDLLTAAFPASTQCLEHVTGDIDIPYHHPLIKESMENCLFEAADLHRLKDVLRDVESGSIELMVRETREPSPFAYERLNANPYAFLDDAPLEERRARALTQRRHLSVNAFEDLQELSPDAIAQVRAEAWPLVRNADELHDALQGIGVFTEGEGGEWQEYFTQLLKEGRASRLCLDGGALWFASERLQAIQTVYLEGVIEPPVHLPEELQVEWTSDEAQRFLIRGQLEVKPIITAHEISQTLQLPLKRVELYLEALESEGGILRGHFTSKDEVQWCDRRFLMRIHRLTLEGLRKQIQPVLIQHYFQFIFRRHGLVAQQRKQGKQGLLETIIQLQGFETSAGEWEEEVFASRVEDYDPSWLDELCHHGVVAWGRFQFQQKESREHRNIGGMNRIVPLAFALREHLHQILPERKPLSEGESIQLSHGAEKVLEALENYGAQFATELLVRTGLLKSHLDEALGELARRGLVTADGFAAIRPFVSTETKKQMRKQRRRSRFTPKPTYQIGGRWSLFPGLLPSVDYEARLEAWAWLLLERYGVVFYDLLGRESCAPRWGELAPIYRRLEARGEIRGGRFIVGVSGEQFALENIVEELRDVRDMKGADEWVVISAADPLNLIGVITEGARVGRGRHVRLLFKNGNHVATADGGEVTFHQSQPLDVESRMKRFLRLSGSFRKSKEGHPSE